MAKSRLVRHHATDDVEAVREQATTDQLRVGGDVLELQHANGERLRRGARSCVTAKLWAGVVGHRIGPAVTW